MKTTWLAALIAFVDAHFKSIMGAIAGNSGIVAVIYGAVADDMVFAIGFAAIFVTCCYGTVRMFRALEGKAAYAENAMAAKIE